MNMPNLENYEFLHGTASKLVQLPGAEPVILTHIEGQVITVTLSAYMNQIAFLVRMVRDDQDLYRDRPIQRAAFAAGQMLNVLEDLLQ